MQFQLIMLRLKGFPSRTEGERGNGCKKDERQLERKTTLAFTCSQGRDKQQQPLVHEGWPNLSHENAIQLIYVLNAITRKAKGDGLHSEE